MFTTTKVIGLTLCAISLSACDSLFEHHYTDPYQSSKQSKGIQLYPDGYDNGGAYAPKAANETKQVVVPETYHVGEIAAPASFKERDTVWISHQNPQGYTIEIAHGENAAEVASTLQKVPKSERTAEVKYQQDGKSYYKGIYGTYPSYEAAQQALSALPEDVKQNAGVKTWGNVQSSVTE